MVTLGYLVRLEAKPGQQAEVEDRMRVSAASIAQEEPGTIAWLALRLGPTSYAVVDVFPDEAARQAHREAGRTRLQALAAALAAPPTLAPTDVVAAGLPHARCEANKATVRAFYAALIRKDFEALSALLGERYIQHNPAIADGRDGLAAFVALLRTQFPELRAEVKRIFVDGDFVIAHVHGVRSPAQPGAAIIDIFRLEDGKIVEHWDVQQPIPEHAANENGMF